jgi:hypothetical protein
MEDLLGRPVIAAAELEVMTPAERKAAFDASVITDLDLLPPAYLAQLRAEAEDLVARRDADQQNRVHRAVHRAS